MFGLIGFDSFSLTPGHVEYENTPSLTVKAL